MSNFKQYQRTAIAEMRPYKEGESLPNSVSISEADLKNGSPKPGDMIARNPKNHNDQWLVSAEYFADNFCEKGQAADRIEQLERENDGLKELIKDSAKAADQFYQQRNDAIGKREIAEKERDELAAHVERSKELFNDWELSGTLPEAHKWAKDYEIHHKQSPQTSLAEVKAKQAYESVIWAF